MDLGPETPAQAADSAAALARGGLPVEAVARLDAMRASSSWTSDLSVQELAAVRSVGFTPVGQVMGAFVLRLGYSGMGGCGYYSYRDRPRVAGTGSGSRSPWRGYAPLVDWLYRSRRAVLARMTSECVALGGDGVVGVELRQTRLPGVADTFELRAVGTAVRSTGSRHLAAPFTCDLSGQDFAKLLVSGWMPCGIALGVAVGVRHDDWSTTTAQRSWSNVEVPGYTELVQETRAQVRREIASDLRAKGGDGLVTRGMRMRVDEQGCSNQGTDHVAEATMVGTAVTRFSRSSADRAPAPLRILRLDQHHDEVLGDRLTDRDREDPRG
ncbi:MAG: heavy metal-binding domain-containing protein [Mycobacteriales bacterium]